MNALTVSRRREGFMLNTQFESQRIVILGGTSGIGLATAERAAADGATVIVASSSPDRIDAALERLPASAEGYTVNVRHEEEIRDLFNRLGSFDHLAFTAGETLQIGGIANTDLSAARRALDVRLWGAYAAVKHAVPHLRPGGSMVLSSGIAGTRPEPNWRSRRLSAARWTRSPARWPSSSPPFASTPLRPAWCAATCGAR
jgi:NAD(P)-dependent dehydrogenase (short-subunit alcohol dehydrogenase family)